MVIFAIPSAFSYLMSSNSPADSHCMLVMQRIIWDLNAPHRESSSQDDINDDYERLSKQGVEFVSPPEERFYGTEAIVKDNSGNWFSLTQPKR
ncbi:MAG: VOC family protein [Rubrobacteraceae bacterium]|nr:VOC family protein [Rubrobacteraceae bacterium]